jgi:TolA-binding protein
VQFARERWEAAEQTYALLLERFPNSLQAPYVLFQKGIAAWQRKAWDSLVGDYQRLLQEHPDDAQVPDALYWSGYALLQQDKLPQAASQFQALVRRFPEHSLAPEGLVKLGVAQYQQDATADAVVTFERVFSQYPETEVSTDILTWVGDQVIAAGRLDDGLSILDRAEQQSAQLDSASPGQVLENILALKINALMNAERYAQGAVEAERFMQAFPRSLYLVPALFVRGKACNEKGEYERALTLLDQAMPLLEAVPIDPALIARINLARGDALMGLQRYDEASDPLLRTGILFIHPELTPEALYKAGQCLAQLQRPEDARRRYEAIVRDYPDSDWADPAKKALQSAGQIPAMTQ